MAAPYMSDPEQLAALRGQQYIVLRPLTTVSAFYEDEQARVLEQSEPRLPHPNAGHVTLRGFFEHERLPQLRASVADWARVTPPIEVQVDAVDGFPHPFQVVIARLARTPSLVGAYASLTRFLDSGDLRRVGELPLDDWVFHLSLVYAAQLDQPTWLNLLAACAREDIAPPPREVITSVDLVSYDGDGEHVKTFALNGA